MRPLKRHNWDLTPTQAIQLQKKLAQELDLEDHLGKIQTVAGADIAVDGRKGYAGVMVYSYPDLQEIEQVSATAALRFPYIPGLLAFREGPVLLEAFQRLRTDPDLVMFDGQGIAHPRRLGIASHLGLLLDRPTIGCAKSLLVGDYREPGPDRGEVSPLVYKGQTVGMVVRTRERVKPIFVSPGHKISLSSAVQVALACVERFRVPKPTREADLFVAALKRGACERPVGGSPTGLS